jgi:hypothetical protein
MTDALMAIWVAAVGAVFALLPLVALAAQPAFGTSWVASVWDAWRIPYGIALLVCAAGVGVRVCRFRPGARRSRE